MTHHNRFIITAMAGTVLILSACTPNQEPSQPVVATKPLSTATSLNSPDSASPESGTPGVVGQLVADSTRPEVVVYKDANCGCCKDWVAYLEDEGFEVQTFNHDNLDQIKAENGLTAPGLKSCHTALVDGYVIEGHVPVSDIERLLAERPDVVGLTAPGMPMMSPGMGSLIPKDYDVLAFKKDGSARVYSSY